VNPFLEYNNVFNNLSKNSIPLNFLDKYIEIDSKIKIHIPTGVISSKLEMSEVGVLDYWSKNYFKSNVTDNNYSATFPFAKSRLYYVLLTLIDHLRKMGNKKIESELRLVDYAAGEGVFIELAKREMPQWRLGAVEGSREQSEKIRAQGIEVLNQGLGFGKSNFQNIDVATILWTLSCSINPLSILKEIKDSLNDDGILVVAESSRILVPYKKSLNDLFSKIHPSDVHPWYFSFRSLKALLVCAGFETISNNRFIDSDVMLLIAKKSDSTRSQSLEFDDPNLVYSFMKNWDYLSSTLFKEFQI